MRCFQVRRRLTRYVERMGSASEMAAITRHLASCSDCARRVAGQHRVKSLLYQISDVSPDPLLWTEGMAALRERCRPSRVLPLSTHPAWSESAFVFRRTRYIVSAAAAMLITIATLAWYALSPQPVTITQRSYESDDMSFYLKEHALHADESVFSDGAFGAVMVSNPRK